MDCTRERIGNRLGSNLYNAFYVEFCEVPWSVGCIEILRKKCDEKAENPKGTERLEGLGIRWEIFWPMEKPGMIESARKTLSQCRTIRDGKDNVRPGGERRTRRRRIHEGRATQKDN